MDLCYPCSGHDVLSRSPVLASRQSKWERLAVSEPAFFRNFESRRNLDPVDSASIEVTPFELSDADAKQVRSRRESTASNLWRRASSLVRRLRGQDPVPIREELAEDSAALRIDIQHADLFSPYPFNEECPAIAFAGSDMVVVITGQCLYDPFANTIDELLFDSVNFESTFFNCVSIARSAKHGYLLSLIAKNHQPAAVRPVNRDDFPFGPEEVQLLDGPTARAALARLYKSHTG